MFSCICQGFFPLHLAPMHQAPCFLLGLQQQLRGFICTLRIPFMSIFLSVLTWILGGGQISRVGSILYVGALGPKMSVFPKDPELPSCQRPSAPQRPHRQRPDTQLSIPPPDSTQNCPAGLPAQLTQPYRANLQPCLALGPEP